jgi:hypothetical protein
VTGYGFCGPMTAMGTVFDAKAETEEVVGARRGPSARGRGRLRGRRMWWLPFFLGA